MTQRLLEIAVAGTDVGSDVRVAARALGTGLLVLPRQPALAAAASDGAMAHAMGELALAAGLPLLFAYAEACSGHRHLALQLVLADGRSTANYRATHLSAAMIAAGWSPGNWLTMARLEPLTLGLLGGIDHWAPEVGRALSGLGAEVLIAVLDPDDHAPAACLASLARLRALENGVPVCLIDPSGSAHAADASGQPIPTSQHAGLVRVTLPVGGAATLVPRRPELYRQLVVIPG
jgi:predicted amidohydrolase